MLGALMNYGDLNAKVKVMRRFLLRRDDYLELIAKKSVGEVVSYLKSSTSYGTALKNVSESSVHRGQIEGIIKAAFDSDCIKLERFTKRNVKKFLSIYIMGHEIAFLKNLIRCLKRGELFVPDTSTSKYVLYSFDYSRVVSARSIDALLEALHDTGYYSVLQPAVASGNDIFGIEMALDMYYYKTAWKHTSSLLEGENRKLVTQTLGTEIDILNLMWIIRSKRHYKTEKDIIYAYLLPVNYRLKQDNIREMAESESSDELDAAIRKTKYSDILLYDDLDIERYYDDTVMKNMKRLLLKNPFSVMSALSFLHDKLIEISNITRIVEGVRYDLDREMLKKYLVWEAGAVNGN